MNALLLINCELLFFVLGRPQVKHHRQNCHTHQSNQQTVIPSTLSLQGPLVPLVLLVNRLGKPLKSAIHFFPVSLEQLGKVETVRRRLRRRALRAGLASVHCAFDKLGGDAPPTHGGENIKN
jgi:hypothetical protein